MIVSTDCTSKKLKNLLDQSGFLIFPNVVVQGKSFTELLSDILKIDVTIANTAYEYITINEHLPLHYHTSNIEFIAIHWEFSTGPGRKFIYGDSEYSPTAKDLAIILPNQPDFLHGTTVQEEGCDTRTRVMLCNKIGEGDLWHKTFDSESNPI